MNCFEMKIHWRHFENSQFLEPMWGAELWLKFPYTPNRDPNSKGARSEL